MAEWMERFEHHEGGEKKKEKRPLQTRHINIMLNRNRKNEEELEINLDLNRLRQVKDKALGQHATFTLEKASLCQLVLHHPLPAPSSSSSPSAAHSGRDVRNSSPGHVKEDGIGNAIHPTIVEFPKQQQQQRCSALSYRCSLLIPPNHDWPEELPEVTAHEHVRDSAAARRRNRHVHRIWPLCWRSESEQARVQSLDAEGTGKCKPERQSWEHSLGHVTSCAPVFPRRTRRREESVPYGVAQMVEQYTANCRPPLIFVAWGTSSSRSSSFLPEEGRGGKQGTVMMAAPGNSKGDTAMWRHLRRVTCQERNFDLMEVK
uniref:MADS-box domain-containing protein n=1 Tax=Setaria digitata TaxID=48799 RepID=A0A915PS55_9BILA